MSLWDSWALEDLGERGEEQQGRTKLRRIFQIIVLHHDRDHHHRRHHHGHHDDLTHQIQQKGILIYGYSFVMTK